MFSVFNGFSWLKCMPFLLALGGALPLAAQNLDQLYNDSLRSKNNMEDSEKERKNKLAQFFSDARDKGMYWKCKNVYIFYAGFVVVSGRDDAADVGKPPFDLIGHYYSHNDFTSFTFPALPYENTFELNVKANELIIYRKTLFKLEKVPCSFMK
jgi:hypothetical protein